MRAVLAGGSGFLGRALADRLVTDGHDVVVLTRRPREGVRTDQQWTPDGSVGPWASALIGADVVLNLAGEGIADRRWSAERKRALRDSRLLPTRSLTRAILHADRPPPVFISGSAVGYYGACGDEPLTEDAPPGRDFLATLTVDWEREAEPAARATRLIALRTGVVLHPSGGALAQIVPVFKMGIGGALGSGRQQTSWIHLEDWVSLVCWLIATPRARGAFNGTAPAPVTNAELTRTLGRVLRRPTVIPVPAFALRVLYGEFADSLVQGQRALPSHAERLGFQFAFRRLEPALRDLL